MYRWTKEDIIKLTEMLIERDCAVFLHPNFRKGMDRKQNLFANQVVRESQGNVAYRSVDFDLGPEMSDDEFWNRIDDTRYNELIEDNAAAALLNMAERLNLLN